VVLCNHPWPAVAGVGVGKKLIPRRAWQLRGPEISSRIESWSREDDEDNSSCSWTREESVDRRHVSKNAHLEHMQGPGGAHTAGFAAPNRNTPTIHEDTDPTLCRRCDAQVYQCHWLCTQGERRSSWKWCWQGQFWGDGTECAGAPEPRRFGEGRTERAPLLRDSMLQC